MDATANATATALISFLQSELLILSNEVKKKHPAIKEVSKTACFGQLLTCALQSIENIFQLIRKLKDDRDRPNPIDGKIRSILHQIHAPQSLAKQSSFCSQLFSQPGRETLGPWPPVSIVSSD